MMRKSNQRFDLLTAVLCGVAGFIGWLIADWPGMFLAESALMIGNILGFAEGYGRAKRARRKT